MKLKIFLILIFSFFILAGENSVQAQDAPELANYYLANLSFVNVSDLAKNDLLILSSTQIAVHPEVINQLKKINPDIIILAYLPSQSYNYQYWTSDVLFRNMQVSDTWWLKDQSGNKISAWSGIYNINMDNAWSRYLVSFANQNITSLYGVDGIFFDMVSENISWINSGNIDMDNNGRKDSGSDADRLWRDRTQYLLKYAHDNLQTKYIVTNGSSHVAFQSFVHGRMFETFPTPWEGNGSWSTVMNNLKFIKNNNKKPNITILNSNSNNTGQEDYQDMRFGLTSALLEDAYFSYDHGDTNHGQTWWYDEYDVNLGDAISVSKSKNNYADYKPDIWQRSFENGVAVVNSTDSKQKIELGGEYEKIHGTQDIKVNDGSIVSQVNVEAKDGVILLKTFEKLENVLFTNGAFLRFFRPDASRIRNGFFSFDEKYKGGDKIAYIDLNGNSKKDLFVASGNKIEAWREDDQKFFKIYPFTANYIGQINIALGDLNSDGFSEIFVAPSKGSSQPIKIYGVYGEEKKLDFYPFGNKYTGGYSLAVGDVDGNGQNELLVTRGGDKTQIYIFDQNFKLKKEFTPFESNFKFGASVSTGNLDGVGADEIIVGRGNGGKPEVRVFDMSGKLLYQAFTAYASLTNPGVDVRALDVDFDGKDDIVTMSEGAF
ncbi:MAG: hypothetical protein ACD_18C00100G0002 [uncultured bacterium]|nr:MAG: hypothetical protein ACD_18C00100G0002 [uncultured bacterium]HAO52765.1 hypothetical protein [Candidatus Magasanikbacteria bacterium]